MTRARKWQSSPGYDDHQSYYGNKTAMGSDGAARRLVSCASAKTRIRRPGANGTEAGVRERDTADDPARSSDGKKR